MALSSTSCHPVYIHEVYVRQNTTVISSMSILRIRMTSDYGIMFPADLIDLIKQVSQ